MTQRYREGMNVYVKTAQGTFPAVVRRFDPPKTYVVRLEVSRNTGLETATHEAYMTPRPPTLTIVEKT